MKTGFYFTAIVALLYFSFCENAKSQTPVWQWAKSIGSNNVTYSNPITLDASGNIYMTGSFTDTMDFDPGPGVYNLISEGYCDIFISKYDSSGNFIWAKSIGSNHVDNGTFIKVDVSGNVYTTGDFTGTTDFDPGSGTYLLATSLPSSTDIFILKLDSSGNFIWAKEFDGWHDNCGSSIAIDAANNVYTTGSFSAIVDFDPDTGVFNLDGGGSSGFISKLDSTGKFVWAKSFASPINSSGSSHGISLVLDDSSNIYTTGGFYDTVDFDVGIDTFYMTSAGGSDTYISKLDSSGNFIWAKQIGGIGFDQGASITIDNNHNLYTAGIFSDTVEINCIGGTIRFVSKGLYDSFISKLDRNGNILWAKSFGGVDEDGISYIVIDANNAIYISGDFEGTTDLDPDSSNAFSVTSAGDWDVYISKLDSLGNFMWAKIISGTSLDGVSGLALNSSGSIFISGIFSSPSIEFDQTTLIDADSSSYNWDLFIAKLNNSITGIENIKNRNAVTIYPDPASNFFTIAFQNNHKKISTTITDITGKIIYTTSTENQNIEINTTNFSDGIYLVQIKSDDFIETKKIIIEK